MSSRMTLGWFQEVETSLDDYIMVEDFLDGSGRQVALEYANPASASTAGVRPPLSKGNSLKAKQRRAQYAKRRDKAFTTALLGEC